VKFRALSLSIALVVVLVPGVVAAQTPERGFVQGIGGLTFGTETAPVFGGGFGVNLGPNFQITGEFGTMRNILPTWVQDDLDDGAAAIEELVHFLVGQRVDVGIDASAPAFYGMGGGRFIASTAGTARPYVGASVGFANVSPEVRLELEGEDVTDEAIDDGFIDRMGSFTDLLLAVGGGVNIAVSESVAIDVGYNFTRIFANQGINVHRVAAGVGYRF
jgi:opacity protein-like surface antigen